MNVTVFGAGGRSGHEVVAEALARGHHVTAVVRRPPDRPLDPSVRVVTGDARDVAAVAEALAGAEGVLSAMGPAGEEPGTSYSDAISALTDALGVHGPARLVITANARVFDDEPLTGIYAGVSAEHRRALATLRASGLDWTVVATPMLLDGEGSGEYIATIDEPGEGDGIDRAGFARAVVDALEQDGWARHAVGVNA